MGEGRRLCRRRSSFPLVFKNENPESQNDRRKISAMENAHNITTWESQEVKVRTEEESISFWMQREPSDNEKIDIAKRQQRRFSELEDSIQSFQKIYAETHKVEGRKSDTDISRHSAKENSIEKEVESQQSDMEQCMEEEEPSDHPVQNCTPLKVFYQN